MDERVGEREGERAGDGVVGRVPFVPSCAFVPTDGTRRFRAIG